MKNVLKKSICIASVIAVAMSLTACKETFMGFFDAAKEGKIEEYIGEVTANKNIQYVAFGEGVTEVKEEEKENIKPENVAWAYYDSMFSGNGEAFFTITMNPYALNYYIADGTYSSERNAKYYYEDMSSEMNKMYEQIFGDNLSFPEFKVLNTFSYSRDYVSKISKYLEENYNYPPGALQNVVVLKSAVTIKGDIKEEEINDEAIVYKIDGMWYVGELGDMLTNDDVKRVLNK